MYANRLHGPGTEVDIGREGKERNRRKSWHFLVCQECQEFFVSLGLSNTEIGGVFVYV